MKLKENWYEVSYVIHMSPQEFNILQDNIEEVDAHLSEMKCGTAYFNCGDFGEDEFSLVIFVSAYQPEDVSQLANCMMNYISEFIRGHMPLGGGECRVCKFYPNIHDGYTSVYENYCQFCADNPFNYGVSS
jgi:hypothetical protein